MKIKSLFEARRNPSVNVKVPLLDRLKQIRSGLDELPDAGGTNGFVSFSFLIKMGINPKPIDNKTPAGIYGYPIDYVISLMEQSGSDDPDKSLPYAGDRPFANIFKARNPEKLLHLQRADVQDFCNRLNKALPEGMRETVLSFLVDNNGEVLHYVYRGNFYRIFQERVDSYQGKQNDIHATKKGPANLLTSILTRMGYDGVFDDGDGQIAFEQYQAVFFSGAAISGLDVEYNHATEMDIGSRVKYERHGGAKFFSQHPAIKPTSDIADVPKRTGYLFRMACEPIMRAIPSLEKEILKIADNKPITNGIALRAKSKQLKELLGGKWQDVRGVFSKSLHTRISSTIKNFNPITDNSAFWAKGIEYAVRFRISLIKTFLIAADELELDADFVDRLNSYLPKLKKLIDFVNFIDRNVKSNDTKKYAYSVKPNDDFNQVAEKLTNLIFTEKVKMGLPQHVADNLKFKPNLSGYFNDGYTHDGIGVNSNYNALVERTGSMVRLAIDEIIETW
jgi:hypothetical protein